MATPSMDMLSWLRKQLEEADVDLLREMVSAFVATLMESEADAICGAWARATTRESSCRFGAWGWRARLCRPGCPRGAPGSRCGS